MSILIRDMEMPKSCYRCPMANDDFYLCGATEKYLENDSEERRPDWCTLVEIPTPHGRLIDIRSVEDGKFVTVGNDYQRWWNGALESVIDNAPTVIEGSET